MSLRAKLGPALVPARRWLGKARGEMLCSLYRREVALRHTGPLVSFAFDDFPRTAYTVGGSILKSMGFRGTYYVAMGLMNTSNHLGDQFRMEDLQGVAQDGHEVASHTFGHISGRSHSLRAFQEDVRKGHNAILDMAGLTPTSNFAYPFGDSTLQTKRIVGQEMSSCRGIVGGLNGRMADLNLLRANSLYGDTNNLAAAERLVLENDRQNGWLIFYTHDVRENPSPYGCTPRLLEAVVKMAAKSNATVLPIADVIAGPEAAMEKPAPIGQALEWKT